MKNENYFVIQLIFATIYGSYCTFQYYSQPSLYYLAFIFIYSTFNNKFSVCCRKLYCTAESFTTLQTALLCSRQLYRITESFTTRQKVLLHSHKALLHSRKFYCAIEDFIAQQRVLPHCRKVSIVAEIGEKFLLWQEQWISPLCNVFPLTWTQRLRTNWQRQSGTLESIPRNAKPNFLLRKSLD